MPTNTLDEPSADRLLDRQEQIARWASACLQRRPLAPPHQATRTASFHFRHLVRLCRYMVKNGGVIFDPQQLINQALEEMEKEGFFGGRPQAEPGAFNEYR